MTKGAKMNLTSRNLFKLGVASTVAGVVSKVGSIKVGVPPNTAEPPYSAIPTLVLCPFFAHNLRKSLGQMHMNNAFLLEEL